MYKIIMEKPPLFPGSDHNIMISDECQDFIKQCLQKDPKLRLGSIGDVKDIFAHPWM